MRLENQVALITGAASGIGREIARTFAREGALVGIADLNIDAGKAAAAEIDPTGNREYKRLTGEAEARLVQKRLFGGILERREAPQHHRDTLRM
jgi:NAD(P)-dependent dehydrogenase (short-subunit alcohol dehydrogenase family)